MLLERIVLKLKMIAKDTWRLEYNMGEIHDD